MPQDNKVLIAKYHWNGSADGLFPVAAFMDVDNGALTEVGTAPIRNARFIADNHGQVPFRLWDGTDQKRRVYYRAEERRGLGDRLR